MKYLASGLFLLFVPLFVCILLLRSVHAFEPAAKVYKPGETMKLTVEDPYYYDIDSVSALMPNGDKVELFVDASGEEWIGYWSVPADMGEGCYEVKVTAIDLDGRLAVAASIGFLIEKQVTMEVTDAMEGSQVTIEALVPSNEANILGGTSFFGKSFPIEQKDLPETSMEKIKVIRVRVGPFRNRSLAQVNAEELRRRRFFPLVLLYKSKYWVQVGAYRDPSHVSRVISKLKEMGFETRAIQ